MTESRKKRATMKDVAQRADVTIGTVSHVLNGTAPISQETRERVQEAIKALNYVPNLAARNMRRRENRQIGLLIPKLTNNFYARIANAFMDEANKEDYTVLMLSYEYSLEQERRGIYSLVQNDVETIVIANGSDDEVYIQELLDKGIHVILADRRSHMKGVSYVAYDNCKVMRQAVEFLKKKGYASVGYLTEPLTIDNLTERFSGYRQGLEACGYPFREEHIFESAAFRQDHLKNGCQYMEKLLASRRREELPDAFIASSDLLAIGAMKAILGAGYRIPGNFGIVGCDNLAISAYVQPALTTICQDRERLGRELWKQARAYREGEEVQNVILDQTLIVRSSC
ncbi:MAG: LacI family DNA-binding transcriptional regulator [Eubacteriales bacterium]|nr:LacI family DNA-binding transcriptional regulator [Eubacteriales bacterium]